MQSVEFTADSATLLSSNDPPLSYCMLGTASFNMVSDRLEDNTLMLVLPIDEKRWVSSLLCDITE